MSFICDKCGECCRHLNNSEIYRALDRGDGVCRFLSGNLCSVYNNRPIICRVDDAYEQFFKYKYSKEEYYKMNYQACSILKKEVK